MASPERGRSESETVRLTHVRTGLPIDVPASVVVDAMGERLRALQADAEPFLGDPQHPDWADYVATNLLDALSQVPDTGDWHGALRAWCERHTTGDLKPNRRGS